MSLENGMNGDQKCAVRIAIVIGAVLIIAIASCTGHNIHQDTVIHSAMEKEITSGADPLLVACAHRPPTDAARCARP